MESAGRAAAHIIQALYPEGRVAAAVGRGNNGGDALVLLRTLRAWGRDVVAIPTGAVPLTTELLHGWEIPLSEGDAAERVFRDAAVLIDGILGTGASGAPREPQAGYIAAMEAAERPIVALDGPTGVDLTRGTIAGAAARAQATIAFGAPSAVSCCTPGGRTPVGSSSWRPGFHRSARKGHLPG